MHKVDKILIIDDDQISNFLTANVIRRNCQTQEITICLDGQEAYNLLKQKSESASGLPNLILVDINMPTMSGFDFLEAFRLLKHGGHMPVIIILTTSDNLQDLERLKDFPEVEVYLNKPLKEDTVQFITDKYFNEQNVSN